MAGNVFHLPMEVDVHSLEDFWRYQLSSICGASLRGVYPSSLGVCAMV
jgi:hypothetical protein